MERTRIELCVFFFIDKATGVVVAWGEGEALVRVLALV